MLRLTFIAATMAVALLAAAGAFAPPRPGQPVLIIAPPWTGGAAAILARSGGREIALQRAPLAILAVMDRPDAALEAGAWAVWDAAHLARLCRVDPEIYEEQSNA